MPTPPRQGGCWHCADSSRHFGSSMIQLQNAFDTVETFLSRSQLPPSWLAFACEPTETTLAPKLPGEPFQITQLLPIPSQGLAAIELHAAAAAADADGFLAVAITTCEDARILGE